MSTVWWIVLGVAAFLLISLVVTVLVTWPITKKIYFEKFVRTSPELWGRACSAPENEEHLRMYDMGMEWAAQRAERKTEVSVESDGLKLVGEYYDFGFERCVLILPGRAESINYCYFFAAPYERAGCNVLVVDTRAHGLSEGKYVGFGVLEANDLVRWVELLRDRFHVRDVVLHGVCLGGATCVLAAARPDFPACVSQIVLEGVYTSFYEVFKCRSKNDGHPAFPVAQETVLAARRYAGVDFLRNAPRRFVGRMKTPVLFLHGRQDVSSLPKVGQEMFDRCGSREKYLLWFDRGAHSHLRINNLEAYDNAIADFLGGRMM